MSKFRAHLTYANVMSSMAFFLALGGGTAFAVTAIDDNSVEGRHIVDGAIKGVDLGANVVSPGKVANSLTGVDISDGSLTASDLGAGSVGTPQLQDLSVNGAKLANLAVTQGKLAPGAVTTDKLGLKAVDKLATGDDSVAAEEIVTGSVGASEIGTQQVTGSEIRSSAVTATDIALDAVGAGEIASSAVGASEIASSGVNGDELGGLTTREKTVPSPAGGVVSAKALCSSGEQIISGGFVGPIDFRPFISVIDGNGWTVGGKNFALLGEDDLTVRAYCLEAG